MPVLTRSHAAKTIEAEFGGLDILVNNAGIADSADGLPSQTDVAAVERIFATNFIGTLRVTQAMLPLVKKSTSGRIVNMSKSRIAHVQWRSSVEVAIKLLGYCASRQH